MNVLDLYEEFEIWSDYLYNHTTLDMPTSKDVCQEVFLKLYERFGDEDMPQENITGYIKGALITKSKEYIRKYVSTSKREKLYIKDFLTHARDTRTNFEELTALFKLIPEYEDLLIKFYIIGISYEELAKKQKTSVVAIKSRLQRGRRAARRALENILPLLRLIKNEIKRQEEEDIIEDE